MERRFLERNSLDDYWHYAVSYLLEYLFRNSYNVLNTIHMLLAVDWEEWGVWIFEVLVKRVFPTGNFHADRTSYSLFHHIQKQFESEIKKRFAHRWHILVFYSIDYRIRAWSGADVLHWEEERRGERVDWKVGGRRNRHRNKSINFRSDFKLGNSWKERINGFRVRLRVQSCSKQYPVKLKIDCLIQ